MKISVSNIAWNPRYMQEYLGALHNSGVDAMELSPSMIWDDPIAVSKNDLLKFTNEVRSYDLKICSMHSLTYPRPDLSFFKGKSIREKLVKYVGDLSKIAYTLDIPYMVYGSGSSRNNPKMTISKNDAYVILGNTFHEMADLVKENNVTLLIEYLPKNATDHINDAKEASTLVKLVNHDNFKMHADLRSSFEINENIEEVWKENISMIKHCHVSDPGMMLPSDACKKHNIAAKIMKKLHYDNYISIETPAKNINHVGELINSIKFVERTYK